ncbi:aldo/keto reductase [Aquisalinus flavus]|uniref:Putative oxidoreductase YcsN n=1 Tax=Aquisalinus flavus TaxID=1526572 RepID=A0A8J2V5C6_9PROT|nr:aldo/keto reductase [Aquisalinus flavus]MBD0427373.1 aldo/keto reductase [Aquisalinus flavus]UNE47178.1 aldo/keto reductase [Aquisalinus flavus]GGD00493.1 putative oxidoreductase YcsN [Aquisalinus flavus]
MLKPRKNSFAFGTWRFSTATYDDLAECLSICKEHGITHIDTADVYGGEEGFGTVETLLGRLRAEAPELFEGTTLATKIGIEFGSPYNQSPSYLRDAMRASLDRLQMDKVDLIYVHRPDNLAHPADVAEVLDRFILDGFAESVAVSNFTPWQVTALRVYLQTEIYAHQIEFSPFYVAPVFEGLLDDAMAHRTRIAAWSPLGGGQLFGDKNNMTAGVLRVREVMDALAKAHNATLADIAYAFVRKHPAGAVPIIGTTKPARLRETLDAAPVKLERKEWYRLLEAGLGRKLP